MDTSVKVILLVKTRRELYDVTHPKYANKRHHTIVWRELAAKMGVDVQHLKAKWNSLRNSYARTIRTEISDPIASEKGWYLKSYMEFLRPHVVHKIKRSQYLEKIRNGDIQEDEDSCQMLEFNETDEQSSINDHDKTEIINSPIHDDEIITNFTNSDDDHLNSENQPIDYIETNSQVMTTVHDFTILDDENIINITTTKQKDEQLINEQQQSNNYFKEINNLNADLNSVPNTNFNIEKLNKLNDKKFTKNLHTEDDEKFDCDRKLRKMKFKKKKKQKSNKKFDKILEILSGFCSEHTANVAANETKSDCLFFQSIMTDYDKLTEKKKRKFKSRVLSELNDLLDETEIENVSCTK